MSLLNHQQPSMTVANYKKLRRLPHAFSKVLELPLNSDADVFIQEQLHCFKFIAYLDDHDHVHGVKAHVIKLNPGIIKVVVRVRSDDSDELDLNVWRYRLSPSTRPELASAVYAHGQLIVTVPKNGWGENINKSDDYYCKGGFKGNMGNLVLVHSK